MIKFPNSKTLNGSKLTNELIEAGVTILSKDKSTQTGFAAPLLDGDNNLWLDIDSQDQITAAQVVADHQA